MPSESSKKTLHKFQNWCDQTYYRLTHLSVRRFWDNIRRWLSYYNVVRKTYDFGI